MPKIAYHQLPVIEQFQSESESGSSLQNLKVKANKWCYFLSCKINVRLTLIICFSFVLAYFVVLVVFSKDYRILNGTRRRWQLVRNQVRHSFGWGGPVKYFGNSRNLSSNQNVDDWKLVPGGGSGDQYFVYSAYIDKDGNNRSILRIIAIAPSYSTHKFECYLKDEDENTYAIVPGHVETGKTYIDTEYSAAFIICSLYLTISSLPEPKYVTLSPGESSQQEDDQEPPTLRIYQNLNRIKHQFGVCVQPIFSYDDTPRFVQWMEYNILMGATHFTFYNISIGPSVSCVLEEYKNSDNGIQVEVLPWSSPIQDDDLLHNNDQYGQASECVFRSRGKIEHLLMIDLDEYIVPSFPDRVQNYGELYIEISAQAKLGLPEGKDAVQFGFANGIFDLDCDNGTEKGEKNENEGIMSVQDLIIYRRITRPKAVDYGQMKFITTPNLVIEPGIHNLANSVDEKYVEFQVKPDLAYLHHYKGNGANNDKCQNPDGVDQSGQFYADKLLPLVNSRMQYVQKYCKFKNN